MDPVSVCGPVNLEISVPVSFPVQAAARRMVEAIEAHVSGIAYNVAAGLAALGTPVRLTAITGTDEVGGLISRHLAKVEGLATTFVALPESPLTVVLLGAKGQRAVLSDLKDAPTADLGDTPSLQGCSAFVPVAIPANVPSLKRARGASVPVLVDLQSVEKVDDPDMEPFCRAAAVLAMSGSRLTVDPEAFLRALGERYGTSAMVMGWGERGALLARDEGSRIDHVPAAGGRGISTVGAGDALWACFIDGYLRGAEPLWALQRAVAAAEHKISSVGGGSGVATAAILAELGWGTPGISLRDVRETDLEVFFEHESDAEASRMAAFPSRDKASHLAHWQRVLADPTNIAKTITIDGAVAGNIGSWQQEDHREVGYWIGREYWGRGIATAALAQLLRVVPTRPLYAHVAAHNAASIRVLQKCGFVMTGRAQGEDGIEELAMVLER